MPTTANLKAIKLVSLVVVARNEEKFLRRLLVDIVHQDFPKSAIELVLVDSVSTDGTRRIMEDFKSNEKRLRRVVVIDNPGTWLPYGCNMALCVFQGEVFLRVDAHARIPTDFVRRNVEVLEAGHMVCGGIRPVILEKPSAWGETLVAAEASAFGASAASYRRSREAGKVSSVFHGAYRREIFAEVGSYDVRLLRTEDNDMSQRIRAAGYQIWMDPRIQSWQYLRPNLKSLLRQKAANAYWIGRTLWLKPKAVSLTHLVPAVFVLALLAGLVAGLLFSWWIVVALAGLYLLVDLALSASAILSAERRSLSMLALLLIFLLMHLCYGTASLAGLLRGVFR